MQEVSRLPTECTELVLEEKDAADWIYRGEGAANLVLAYKGSSPSFVGKVIRLQKAPKNISQSMNGTSVFSVQECLLWKDTNDLLSSTSKENVGQLYSLHIMSPLLGSEHVDPGMRILVSKEFLESVEKNVLCQRPAWRVDAANINILCDSALLVSDHSVFPHGILKEEPCISVEIKPKCGFLPSSRFIAEGNFIKRSITRFRMHQVLKHHEGEISQISEYDPLDLFSGSSERIHKAIKALFTTPQNNFRIFLNSSLIFGGLGGGRDSTDFVMGESFEDKMEGIIRADYGLRTASFLQLVAEAIFRSGVLDRLLEAQKLDLLDIEGAIHAYYNIVSQPCVACRDLAVRELSHSLHSISLEESLKIVRDYLVAATAKDCSFMISFRPREDGDPSLSHRTVCLEPINQNFDYKVNFIDLDLKPLKKMLYYYELDQKIVSCYNQMNKEHGISDTKSMERSEAAGI
ncbi:PREDICTED: inositol-pentakisphosphate 2-kinase-like isoform X2 [Nelumbo nucifera]|uniref:Inositol-pentakisphosphate 2-kinase n=1 Tax=Nelumbo nucifera TaxID=4432 RepID=A0A1U7ZL63_NELNU|nr:PREDICTED: inositol-pentakisphosphate 2-kinase-like isoform X2 [Nelumbo nucifera]